MMRSFGGSSGTVFGAILALSLLGATAGGLAAAPAPAPAAPHGARGAYILRPARVFTAESVTAHDGWAVVVEGERITAVGPAAAIQVPAGAEAIDLPGATLLPGLMDLHSHLFL